MSTTRRTAGPFLATALLALASACGDDHYPEAVTEIDVEQARAATSRASDRDPYVVAPAVTPRAPGRIIYEPPASLAQAPPADTAASAAADTSGRAPARPERR